VREGVIEATLVTLGLNVHLLPRRSFDLYLGPLVGQALHEDVSFPPEVMSGPVKVKDGSVYGAVLGLDLPLGKGRWRGSMAIRALRTTVKLDRVPRVFRLKLFPVDDEEPDSLHLDPVEVRIGLACRIGRPRG
jgi:hypothetical protein